VIVIDFGLKECILAKTTACFITRRNKQKIRLPIFQDLASGGIAGYTYESLMLGIDLM
jgi:hypothetical protein